MDFPFMHVEDYGVSHEFRSLNGRVRVPFRWEPPHEIGGVSPVSLVQPLGSEFPIARRLGNAPAQAFPIRAVTVGDDTAVLERLLAQETTIGVVHSSQVCSIRECQIPEFQIVHVTDFPRGTTGHVTVQTYEWDLTCVPADPATVGPVPLWVWGDLADMHNTWGDVEGAYVSWGDAEEGQ